ncbi:dual specificity phosphatase, catalytic domain protein [Ancylostoma ceylanicum]|uniref:Dual specificity phosphatase, catalytic domain protein n=1 Tax=Ancylostoma ceylanicum TaxID=53326 RepID=A0A0D6LC98_9BILA|nr:dual specificity phosphatase, catalytic domain protein [Ancylostoma ceylanicum]
MGFVVDLQPDLQIALICPGVYLGSQDVAGDLAILEAEGITHIVNCATGVPNYYPKKFTYLHLEVFVHCNAGISRAATFVISYLMAHHNMSLQLALETVKHARPKVRPNMGFMKQLKIFEESLTTNKV